MSVVAEMLSKTEACVFEESVRNTGSFSILKIKHTTSWMWISYRTRLNSNSHDKATLLDMILTISPHMYQSGVFCNDLSDYCFIACIRKNISAKQSITNRTKRSLKHFNIQAFLHDLANINWHRISLVLTGNERSLFRDQLSAVTDKHAPSKKQ